MAITNVFTLYAVDVDDLFIDQITNFNINPGLAQIIHSADGNVDPEFVATNTSSPSMSFTTSAIATALAGAGIGGKFVSAAALDDPCVAYFQNVAAGGTRGGAGTNLKMEAENGMLIPISLTANQSLATIDYAFYALSTSAQAAPVSFTADQDIAGSPSVDEVFVAGPVKINNANLDAVMSVTINFGIQLSILNADGNAFPTFAGIIRRSPMITVGIMDAEYLATTDLVGAKITTTTYIYLRKVASGSTRVADGTGQHIRITVPTNSMVTFDSFGGSHGAEAGGMLRITPAGALTISTASTIT